MFPIDIMPVGVQAALKWAPFYYELFCPVAIFLERLKGAELWQALAIQTGMAFSHLVNRAKDVASRIAPLSGGRIENSFFEFAMIFFRDRAPLVLR